MTTAEAIHEDMQRLDAMLRQHVTPHLQLQSGSAARVLDLACGRCDEAETLIKAVGEETGSDGVQLIGADIRIREIRQARERFGKLGAEFLLEDASNLTHHKQLGEDFDLLFLRHQNFWNGPELWKGIFDQGLEKLSDDGLMVITSYFDKEHELALEALQKMGAQVVLSKRNDQSRALPSPGKSVDRWMAVLRKPR